MEVVSVQATNQCDLYTIKCQCGREFKWPAFLAVIDCNECHAKELLYPEKQGDPGLNPFWPVDQRDP